MSVYVKSTGNNSTSDWTPSRSLSINSPNTAGSTTVVSQGYISTSSVVEDNQPQNCTGCDQTTVYGPYNIANIASPTISNIIGKQISHNGEWHLTVTVAWSFDNSTWINTPASGWNWDEPEHSRDQYSYPNDKTVNNSAGNTQLWVKTYSHCERHYVTMSFDVQTWVDTSYTQYNNTTWKPVKTVWTNVNGTWKKNPVYTVVGEQEFGVGSHTFTIPAGVTTMTLSAAAGGGGGGASETGDQSCSGQGGGGGGGGSFAYGLINVSAGQTLSISVGGAGAGGPSHRTDGSAGGNTTLTGSNGININLNSGSGGIHGGNNYSASRGVGGEGGNTGTINWGTGGSGTGYNGGEGGTSNYSSTSSTSYGSGYQYTPGSGCSVGQSGQAITSYGTGGTGGLAGGYSGGGGGGGGSFGDGGRGGNGNGASTDPRSAGMPGQQGGGGGGDCDEQVHGNARGAGGAGFVYLSWG
jgi:hypothetical protein